jgi:copper chaperone
MRKVLITAIAAVALFGLSTANLSACGGDKATESKSANASGCASKATAKMVSSEQVETKSVSASGCSAAKEISAQTASAHSADCAALCAGKNCSYTTMSIKGMTCGGCEQSVKTALMELDGVIKVVEVNYKEGYAKVCVDATKCNNEKLTMAVANKGFKAEVIPAVATTGAPADAKLTTQKSSCAATCAAAKAAKTEVKAEQTAAGTQ